MLRNTNQSLLIGPVIVYLQTWDTFADWLRIFPKDALLIQELAVPPIARRLKQPVVQDVLQALIERTQDPLLSNPDGGVRVEPHAFLMRKSARKKLIKQQ